MNNTSKISNIPRYNVPSKATNRPSWMAPLLPMALQRHQDHLIVHPRLSNLIGGISQPEINFNAAAVEEIHFDAARADGRCAVAPPD